MSNYVLKIVFLSLILFVSGKNFSQHTDLVDDSQTQILADTTARYFIPDATQKEMRWSRTKNKMMSLE